MIKYLKIATLVISFFFTQNLFSQWYKLPSPYIGSSSMMGIIPTSNKNFIYGTSTQISPSSGGYISTFRSTNDLSSSSCISGCTPSHSYGCCQMGLFQSYNDSNYTYIAKFQGWNSHVFKFSGTPLNSALCPTNNSPIVSTYITLNSAYALSIINSNNDTVVVTRNKNTIPVNQIFTKLGAYLLASNSKLHFLNDSIGFLNLRQRNTITKSVLLKTSNYGISWTDICLDSINQISDFDFVSENLGYITKNNGTVYKTIDGGINWVATTNPGINSPRCIKFSNDSIGYIAGDGNILKRTIDGGTTWTNQIHNDLYTIISLHTFDTIAYFVDTYSSVYKYQTPLNIGINEKNAKNGYIKIFPNPSDHQFTIEVDNLSEGNLNIEIYNILGKSIYRSDETYSGTSFSKDISLKNISNGSYIITVKNGGKTYNQKLIVSKQ